jgi:hypothetical protein
VLRTKQAAPGSTTEAPMRVPDYGRGVMSSIFRRREDARNLKGGQKVWGCMPLVDGLCVTSAAGVA